MRKAKVSVNTFLGAKPLIIIDGVEQPDQDIDQLNPDDIESIDVLKDVTSVAQYGVKGKHGVIRITTKKK
jgi:TonB-dependent SusC/RagA subfamily outer membrane receptor